MVRADLREISLTAGPRSEQNEQAVALLPTRTSCVSKDIQIGTGKRVRTLGFLRVVNKRIIADALTFERLNLFVVKRMLQGIHRKLGLLSSAKLIDWPAPSRVAESSIWLTDPAESHHTISAPAVMDNTNCFV